LLNQNTRIESQKIPELKFAENTKKHKFFNSPMLTPVTFVSKDQDVSANYVIDSDPDEVELPEKYQNAHKYIKE